MNKDTKPRGRMNGFQWYEGSTGRCRRETFGSGREMSRDGIYSGMIVKSMRHRVLLWTAWYKRCTSA